MITYQITFYKRGDNKPSTLYTRTIEEAHKMAWMLFDPLIDLRVTIRNDKTGITHTVKGGN